ncbi:hypothetical protein [Bacillus marasmi]|uniref:hypothetical protein n=1 Tax=Bacillus marasmi TaxID=1926279 RepID=UPI0011CBBB74|nr:hypothetical protein [Bacillus marasmi]
MKRNRYILCMLLCGWMIYYAGPKLQVFEAGAEGIFAITWLLFALMVMAGNLTGVLYSSKPQKYDSGSYPKKRQKKKVRSFHG